MGDEVEVDKRALKKVWAKHLTSPDFLTHATSAAKAAKLDRDALLKYKRLLKDTRSIAEHVPGPCAKELP
eukprot:97980-Pyramimonas_sp.AAC.3